MMVLSSILANKSNQCDSIETLMEDSYDPLKLCKAVLEDW